MNKRKDITIAFWLLFLIILFPCLIIDNKPNTKPYSFKQTELLEFNLPPDFLEEKTCRLLEVIQKKYMDDDYVVELASIVVEEAWQQDVRPAKIAAIIWKETTWLEQKRVGKKQTFKPSSTGDYGPMQVNQIHLKRFGPKFTYDLRENIRVGIIIFTEINKQFGHYNGSGIGGDYHKSVSSKYKKYVSEIGEEL